MVDPRRHPAHLGTGARFLLGIAEHARFAVVVIAARAAIIDSKIGHAHSAAIVVAGGACSVGRQGHDGGTWKGAAGSAEASQSRCCMPLKRLQAGVSTLAASRVAGTKAPASTPMLTLRASRAVRAFHAVCNAVSTGAVALVVKPMVVDNLCGDLWAGGDRKVHAVSGHSRGHSTHAQVPPHERQCKGRAWLQLQLPPSEGQVPPGAQVFGFEQHELLRMHLPLQSL